MIESVYITLIIIAFALIPLAFYVRSEDNKFMQQVVLLGLSAVLFGAVAAGSFNVEIFTCTVSSCVKDSFIFEDNAFMFGFLSLLMGILTLIKSFDAFNFARNKL